MNNNIGEIVEKLLIKPLKLLSNLTIGPVVSAFVPGELQEKYKSELDMLGVDPVLSTKVGSVYEFLAGVGLIIYGMGDNQSDINYLYGSLLAYDACVRLSRSSSDGSSKFTENYIPVVNFFVGFFSLAGSLCEDPSAITPVELAYSKIKSKISNSEITE